MPLLVDVHAHLDHIKFREDIGAAIARAKEAGLKAIISNGVNPETNRLTLELAKKYPIIKAALGIYPIDALSKEIEEGDYPLKPNVFDVDEEIKFIEKNKNNIIAIGEVGLDDHHVKGHLEKQKEVFQKLISLSEKINKPLIVHSRKAEQQAIDLLESSKAKKVVMHCFSGNMKLVKRIEDNGWSFSIPTNIVFSKHFQEIVERVNLSKILTETDAPYLSPFKGKRNEPAYIAESIKKIAEIKKMDIIEVENNIWMNYERMFL